MAKHGAPVSPTLVLSTLSDAERLIGAGKLDEALGLLDRIAAAAMNSAEFHRLRGEALGRKRDLTAATSLCLGFMSATRVALT